jgi:hypothetical protein
MPWKLKCDINKRYELFWSSKWSNGLNFEVYLTEETMEINDRFSPIFQTLEFRTDNKAIIVDMIVAVMEYNKTKVSSSENSFKICTCKMNIESETL